MSTENITSAKTLTNEDLVQNAFKELLTDYLNSNHRGKGELITKAFNFANQAHAGVKRKSGEPYILHPIAVARIVSQEMGLGSTSICAALLHDVVEDTEYTVEDISHMFGEKIAQIVDGLTKISGGIFGDKVSMQAENFRKLLLTMNDDIRVVLVKMADRLHNMRTLGSMLPAKQFKIAGETQYIYAPLAHRLGLFAIKSELEDLSFSYEHPEEYKAICERLLSTQESLVSLFETFSKPIDKRLVAMGLTYDMRARLKSAYSIWHKMRAKNVSFDEIYDVFAIRIIFDVTPNMDEKKQCFDIYAAIASLYAVRPDRFRDWVNSPKANGYQALHMTVMGPLGRWVEVQIRSRRMDDIAEKGFAAHWKYKDASVNENSELDKWLQTITELLENPNSDAMDFLDTIKMNLFNHEISVFTPKGELKTLPLEATALDFAYALHSNIGDHCIGAKVNHKLVPISHILKNGDQVEILTSNSHLPQAKWLTFITTARARTKIDAFLKKQRREMVKSGEQKTIASLKRSDMDVSVSNQDRLAAYFGFAKREDLFYAVEKGDIVLSENVSKFLQGKKPNVFMKYMKQALDAVSLKKDNHKEEPEEVNGKPKIDPKKTYVLREHGFERNYTLAECCKPIPGDDALGFVDECGNVVVHKRSCKKATRLKSSYGGRILSTEWSSHSSSFEAIIEIKGIDSIGVLSLITKTISEKFNVNIIRLLVEVKDGFFESRVKLNVHDVQDIQSLCRELSCIEQVRSVSRVIE